VTDFPFFPNIPAKGESTLSRALSGNLSNTLRSNQDVVFIDVGARRIDSNVVRDGLPIGVHTVDPEIFQDIIIDRPVVAFRVVAQTVPPGTPVPQSTAIDVVMARPGNLPVGVITGVLTQVALETVDTAFDRFVAGNADVRHVVARSAQGPLSEADEQIVRTTFTQRGVEITDEPGSDIDAALETLRMLTTFGGT